jgi:predicted CXXCH cytochrome family protein
MNSATDHGVASGRCLSLPRQVLAARAERQTGDYSRNGKGSLGVLLMLVTCLTEPAWSQQYVVETLHNLSVSGAGELRAESEEQVCVFCHAPHGTGGAVPLWNREFPLANYQIYQSSTFDASPGQPTGTSKLCLSCHDGTIALGRVLSRVDRIRMVSGEFMPAGLSNLGADLSDDHPISFHYTSGLAASDQQLKSPETLPAEIKLDPSGQLQCTACHDPHHNRYRMFLTVSDAFGALCMACHDMDGWSTGSHGTDGRAVAGAANGDWPFDTVAENSCRCCHRSHTAGGPERLLIFENEEDNCLVCHDGRVARFDIGAELDKPSGHDPRLYVGIHDPTETLARSKPHVECADCHNPHAVTSPIDQGYVSIGATMRRVPGVTLGGGYMREAQFEYEVCYRCHGNAPVPVSRRIARQADQTNLRLEFSPANPSFHPIVEASPTADTVSLDPAIPQGTLIRCTDCHNNDTGPRAGGNGPDGPHGSVFDFLLERNYTVHDDTPESAYDYALCYKCHRRASILNDESFPEHARHVRDQDTPCSACHDSHGVSPLTGGGSDHTHLINFDVTIVRPLTRTGRMAFRDLGRFAGSCTLTCHGHDHDNTRYGN